MYTEEEYDTFAQKMHEKHPQMFNEQYGGFCIGPGWWPIIEALCDQIDSYTKWKNRTREYLLKDNSHGQTIPDEIKPVVVAQIKEKFGGLRFYYDGGNEHISGMVRMAEIWAGAVCEECGKPGKSRNSGWIKTLCDEHEAERQTRLKERLNDEA